MKNTVTFQQNIPCYCENCRCEIPFNVLVCPQCKKKFDAIRCPLCEYSAEPDRFFHGCPQCGYLSKTLSLAQEETSQKPPSQKKPLVENKKDLLTPSLILLTSILGALILRILWLGM